MKLGIEILWPHNSLWIIYHMHVQFGFIGAGNMFEFGHAFCFYPRLVPQSQILIAMLRHYVHQVIPRCVLVGISREVLLKSFLKIFLSHERLKVAHHDRSLLINDGAVNTSSVF